MRLRKGGRRREGFVGIHDERMEVGGTATGHLHRRAGALTRLGLPSLHSLHPLGTAACRNGRNGFMENAPLRGCPLSIKGRSKFCRLTSAFVRPNVGVKRR